MLHHVEIYVSDLETSRAFYDFLLTKLGYSLYQEWEGGFSMALYDSKSLATKESLEPLMQFEQSENSSPMSRPEQYLVFVQTPEDFLEVGYHRCRTGLNHLAFHAGTPDDVDQWRKEFLTRRVKLLYDDRYPHAGGPDYYALYLEDPDGIKIELVGEERNKKV
ncbi:TPA: VOC family protein [Streptococcus suis]|nr:VOC family protein [Streptococcus suis]HEL1812528.1 VOC family protein [Streptococcus suis]